jgi:hypothetical protein
MSHGWNQRDNEQVSQISHGRRNFKDTNPYMSSLLVIFGLEWCSNFVGSESESKT